MIVADATLLIHLFIAGPDTDAADAVIRRDADVAAPRLVRSEVLSVLLKYRRASRASQGDVARVLAELDHIIGDREFEPEPTRVLELALRSGCSSYDCEYVAVAEALGVPLVTSDRQVLAAFPGVAVSPAAFAT